MSKLEKLPDKGKERGKKDALFRLTSDRLSELDQQLKSGTSVAFDMPTPDEIERSVKQDRKAGKSLPGQKEGEIEPEIVPRKGKRDIKPKIVPDEDLEDEKDEKQKKAMKKAKTYEEKDPADLTQGKRRGQDPKGEGEDEARKEEAERKAKEERVKKTQEESWWKRIIEKGKGIFGEDLSEEMKQFKDKDFEYVLKTIKFERKETDPNKIKEKLKKANMALMLIYFDEDNFDEDKVEEIYKEYLTKDLDAMANKILGQPSVNRQSEWLRSYMGSINKYHWLDATKYAVELDEQIYDQKNKIEDDSDDDDMEDIFKNSFLLMFNKFLAISDKNGLKFYKYDKLKAIYDEFEDLITSYSGNDFADHVADLGTTEEIKEKEFIRILGYFKMALDKSETEVFDEERIEKDLGIDL